MNPPSHQRNLILASGSPYRAELLARLELPFSSFTPDLDERMLPGEGAAALTARLAQAKAEVIARQFPAAVVVGSDQVAELAGRIVGKPGDAPQAEAQLLDFSGRTVRFVTAVAVVCAELGLLQQESVLTEARFRTLSEDEIRRYIALDQPLDCAGAFKSEAAGPMLLQSLRSEDPTAIIGLPLIALSQMLRQAGFRLP